MSKRVLLITPRIIGVKGGINRIQPSLGVGYLAAVLEKFDFDVAIYDAALGVDERVELPLDGDAVIIGDTDETIARKIADFNPDFIGISILFSGIASQGLHIAKIAKQVLPQVPVIVGGNHVSGVISDYAYAQTVCPVATGLQRGLHDLSQANVDYAMIGECDFALAELITLIDQNAAPIVAQNIPGVVSFANGQIILPGRGNLVAPPVDMHWLLPPARHLMDMPGYFNYGRFHSTKSTSNRVLNIMASRGCPEKCAFCSTPRLWGQKVRWRNSADILAEITDSIDRYGIKEIQFEDDTITANLGQLKELCGLLKPLGLPWCTPNGIKANYHAAQQQEMFQLMNDAGCYQVTLACESGVQRVLNDIVGKRLQVADIAPAIARAKAAGLFVHTFWIAGFPGETRAEMERSVEVAAACGADSVSFAILTPLPGTPIFRQVVQENLWWPTAAAGNEINYRRSSIKADGFASAAEFEAWIASVNERLNRQLAEQDLARAKARSAMVFDQQIATSGMKQT